MNTKNTEKLIKLLEEISPTDNQTWDKNFKSKIRYNTQEALRLLHDWRQAAQALDRIPVSEDDENYDFDIDPPDLYPRS